MNRYIGMSRSLTPPDGVDKFISADLQSGRMVEVIQRGEPALALAHWTGIYWNGEEHGFKIWQEVVRRLHARFDHLLWMKLSEVARYWAAKELTEKGLNTLVLEAGRPIEPGKDYVEHVPIWQKKFRDMGDRNRFNREQPVQQKCNALDELNSKFFVNDNQNPYTTDENKPFLWIRGRQVGGRSIIWGRQSYRWSDLDFEANLRDGIAVDEESGAIVDVSDSVPGRWADITLLKTSGLLKRLPSRSTPLLHPCRRSFAATRAT